MSDTPPPPDWLPYARDRLHEVGLDEAAEALPLLYEAIELLEGVVQGRLAASMTAPLPGPGSVRPLVDAIARARGETPQETIRRLSPPPPPAIRGAGGNLTLPGGVTVPIESWEARPDRRTTGQGRSRGERPDVGIVMTRDPGGEFLPYRPFRAPADDVPPSEE